MVAMNLCRISSTHLLADCQSFILFLQVFTSNLLPLVQRSRKISEFASELNDVIVAKILRKQATNSPIACHYVLISI